MAMLVYNVTFPELSTHIRLSDASPTIIAWHSCDAAKGRIFSGNPVTIVLLVSAAIGANCPIIDNVQTLPVLMIKA